MKCFNKNIEPYKSLIEQYGEDAMYAIGNLLDTNAFKNWYGSDSLPSIKNGIVTNPKGESINLLNEIGYESPDISTEQTNDAYKSNILKNKQGEFLNIKEEKELTDALINEFFTEINEAEIPLQVLQVLQALPPKKQKEFVFNFLEDAYNSVAYIVDEEFRNDYDSSDEDFDTNSIFGDKKQILNIYKPFLSRLKNDYGIALVKNVESDEQIEAFYNEPQDFLDKIYEGDIETQFKDSVAQKESHTIDDKQTYDSITKMYLSIIPKRNEKGRIIKNDMGLPTFYSFNEMYARMTKYLSKQNIYNLDTFIGAMIDAGNNSYISGIPKEATTHILKALGVTPNPDGSVTYNDSNNAHTVRMKFYKDFHKRFLDQDKLLVGGNGAIYSYSGLESSIAEKFKKLHYDTQFNLALPGKSDLGRIASVNGINRLFVSASNIVPRINKSPYVQGAFEKALEHIKEKGSIKTGKGRVITKDELIKVFDGVKGGKIELYNASLALELVEQGSFENVKNGKPVVEPERLNEDLYSQASEEAHLFPELFDVNIRGVDNKSLYPVTQTTFADETIKKIRNAESIDSLPSHIKDTIWGESLFDDNTLSQYQDLKVTAFNGYDVNNIGQKAPGKGNKYNRQLAKLYYGLVEGKWFTPTHSDKTTNYAININTTYNPKVYYQNEFDTLVKLTKDYHKNKEHYDRIGNFKPEHLRFFQGLLSEKTSKMLKKAISENDISALNSMKNAVVTETESQIEKAAKSYYENLSDVLPFNPSEFNQRLKGNWPDLIKEFYIRDRIAKNQMTKLFYGDPAFFKDFHKRAAYTFSTKDFLATGNAVANQYYESAKKLKHKRGVVIDFINKTFFSKNKFPEEKKILDNFKDGTITPYELIGYVMKKYNPKGDEYKQLYKSIRELISEPSYRDDMKYENAVNLSLNNFKNIVDNGKTVVFNDTQLSAPKEFFNNVMNHKNYNSLPKYQKKLIENAYSQIEATDAAAWVSLDAWKQYMDKAGKLDVKYLKAYTNAKIGNPLTINKFQNLVNPLKMMHSEVKSMKSSIEILNKDGSNSGININAQGSRPLYHKYALIPLMPELFDIANSLENLDKENYIENRNNIANELFKINEYMRARQLDYVTYKSASKAGAALNNTIQQEVLNKENGKYTNTFVDIISYENLGVQVDVTPTIKGKVTDASQGRKVFIMDAPDERIQQLNQELFKKYSDLMLGDKGSKLSKFAEKYGLNFTKEANGITFEIKDDTEFFEKVVRSMMDSGKPYTDIMGMQMLLRQKLASNDKSIKVDFFGDKGKIENILLSLFYNDIIKNKFNGDAYIQASSVHIGTDLKWYRTTNLKGEDVVLPAEIAIPLNKDVEAVAKGIGIENIGKEGYAGVEALNSLNEMISKVLDKYETGEELTINEQALLDIITVVANRIPIQGHNSLEGFRVKRFTTPNLSPTVFVPKELPAKSGSDFDVDKLQIYRPLFDYNSEEDKLYKDILDMYSSTILSYDNFLNLIMPNDASFLKDIAKGKNNNVDSEAQLNILDTAYNDEVFDAFNKGKALVGIFALNQTYNALAQSNKLDTSPDDNPNTYFLGYTKENEIILGKIPFVVNRLYDKHLLDENGNEYPDGEKLLKSTVNAQLIDGSVDVAKDPWIFDLGLNLDVAAGFGALINKGVHPQILKDILTHPEVKNVIKKYEIAKSLINAKNNKFASIKNTLKNEFRNEMGDTIKFTDILKNNFERNKKTEVLSKFAWIIKIGEDTTDFRKSTNYDTIQMSQNSNALMEKLLNTANSEVSMYYHGEKLNESSKNKLLKNSIIAPFKQAFNSAYNYISHFNIESKAIQKKIVTALSDIPYINQQVKDRINKSIPVDLYLFKLVNGLNNTRLFNMDYNEISNVFRENNVKDIVSSVKNEFPNNVFARNLMSFFDETTRNDILTVNTYNISKDLNLDMVSGFSEILDKQPDLAKKLVMLNVLQGGMAGGANSIMSYVPTTYIYNNLKQEPFSELDEIYVDKFIDMFSSNRINGSIFVSNMLASKYKINEKTIKRFKDGAAAIEFELLNKSNNENTVDITSEKNVNVKPGVSELFESNFAIFTESKTSDEVINKLLVNKVIDKKCS